MINVLKLFFSTLLVFVVSCIHSNSTQSQAEPCKALLQKGTQLKQIAALNLVSQLYRAGCYPEVIAWAEKVHKAYEDKDISIWRESIEFFIPEGTVTDYVLESYERAYLRFLTSASFLKLGNRQGALVELRRYYNEERARTYNYGLDPVNALLQAAMWDLISEPEFSSRPFWLRLSRQQNLHDKILKFATQQLKDIDAHMPRPQWEIHQVGTFPQVRWKMNFINAKDGYLEIKPKGEFPKACAAEGEVLFDTKPWFEKIATRHSNAYHPLVNAKSWLRTPFAAIYFLSTAAAGAGIMVGGCSLDVGGKGDGSLCAVSIKGGVAVMMKSDDVASYTLKPDLRYWEQVPAAILLRAPNTQNSTCFDTNANTRLL